MYSILSQETICALASAPGRAGISVIRLSGPKAFSIASKYFYKKEQVNIEKQEARKTLFGIWKINNEVLDEVVLTPFFAPHSFTGEDCVEVACHGSSFIIQEILASMLSAGARIAQAGEFSQRAFFNGKMDLSRAEAVMDIIAAESKSQHKMAIQQLRGDYSKEFNLLREELLKFTGLMELELDFAEEDVNFADRSELLELQSVVVTKIQKLIDSFKLGNAVKNGIPVAIVGATNVGKSTLLNRLLGEERAIVSDIHGTTRDTIEDTIHIGGYLFRFVDTAGIRNTEDQIEALGIERSQQKIREAQIILALLDAERIEETETIKEQFQLLPKNHEAKIILLINKTENLTEQGRIEIEQRLSHSFNLKDCISVSAKENINIDKLKEKLLQIMNEHKIEATQTVVSNLRHHKLLLTAKEALERLREGLEQGLSTDLLTFELRSAISSIGEITGQDINRDDTLHYIFKNFCIGK